MNNKDRLKKGWRSVVVAVVCLSLGLLIYSLTRSGLLFMKWFGMSGTVGFHSDNWFVNWAAYSLPDGLWYFALLLLQTVMLQSRNALSMAMWLISAILPFVLELMQAFRVIPGTFDWQDMTTYLITLIIFLLCKRKNLF